MLTIKEATLKDIPTLINVIISSYLDSYTYLWEDQGEHYMSTQFNKDTFRAEIEDPNCSIYLLFFEKEPVGVLKILHHYKILTYSGQQALKLDRIYLIKKATGKGIGKKSMQFVFEKARALNKEVVVLDSMEQDNPMRIYEKVGFVVEGKMSLELPFAREEYKPMVIMVYHLNT